MAMVMVALVATLAATAFWQQWRATEVESAGLTRLRASWVLSAAFDAAQGLLRQDGRNIDDLSEAWAVPLPPTRLSALAGLGFGDAGADVLLSRRIVDLQGRLNVFDLVESGAQSGTGLAAFTRLFARLKLPPGELALLRQRLQASMDGAHAGEDAGVALRPARTEDLVRFGLSPQTLARLAPFVTWLPARTMVNLNTAPPEVLFAAIPNLDAADERKLLHFRASSPFSSLNAVITLLGTAQESGTPPTIDDELQSVNSRYFGIDTTLRLGQVAMGESAVVMRSSSNIRVLSRLAVPP